MVKFETIKSDEVKFGTNNFIEIARKKAITEDSENTFLSISRGFVDQNGNRRYRTSVSLPLNQEVVDFVADAIKVMGSGAAPEVKKAKKKQEESDEEENEEESKEESKEEIEMEEE